jgi:hypothetical protein
LRRREIGTFLDGIFEPKIEAGRFPAGRKTLKYNAVSWFEFSVGRGEDGWGAI